MKKLFKNKYDHNNNTWNYWSNTQDPNNNGYMLGMDIDGNIVKLNKLFIDPDSRISGSAMIIPCYDL